MQVVGLTNQQEVFIASKDRRFKINEILIIEDEFQGEQKCEVVQTQSYNKYVPLALNSELVDSKVLQSLEVLGYKVSEDTIHVAKVRLFVEAEYPVQTAANVRTPVFDEVRSLLVSTEPEKGLVIGIIKSTKEMNEDLPDNLKNISPLFQNDSIVDQNGIPFIFDIYKMNQYPHIGIFGGSGSGKSFGIRVLLEEMMKLKIPTIVLDPHYEMDFSLGLETDKYKDTNFKDKFVCYQVGHHIGVNFVDLSPLDLKNLLNAISMLSEAMSSAVEQLHKKKDTFQSFSYRIDLLREAHDIGNNNKEKIGQMLNDAICDYEKQKYKDMLGLLNSFGDIPGSSINGISWRLRNLEGQGIFNNDITPVQDGLKNSKMVIIQGSSKLLQVFSTYLVNNIYRKRRSYKDAQYRNTEEEYFPPFVIVTDEAHNFAPKGYEAPAKGVLKEIAQEGRKYGVFLIFATQRPTLLDETITAQLNTKIVFRTVRGTDIATIREETDITPEEAGRLPYLQSGDAFISSAIIGRTVPIRIRMAKTQSPHLSNPFDELSDIIEKEQSKIFEFVKEELPFLDGQLNKVIQNLEQHRGFRISYNDLIAKLEQLSDNGKISKRNTPFGIEWNVG